MQSIQVVILLIDKKRYCYCLLYFKKIVDMDLYQAELMDHYRHPRNQGVLEAPDFSSGSCNPSCGDSVQLMGQIKNGVVLAIRFQGKGCVISQAAASMLTQSVLNKTIQEIMALNADFMLNLVGIPLGPMRIKCALLPLEALQKGINTYINNQG